MTLPKDVCISKQLNDWQLEVTRRALLGVLNQGLAVLVECSEGCLKPFHCNGGRCRYQMWYRTGLKLILMSEEMNS